MKKFSENNKLFFKKNDDGSISKLCIRCMKYLPMNEEYFRIRKEFSCGYNSFCLDCEKEISKERNSVRKENNLLLKEGKLKCTKCGEIKSISEFNVGGPKYRAYRSALCKKCGSDKKSNRNIGGSLEKILKTRISGCKTRSKKNNYKFDITIDQLIELYNKQNGKCAISDIKMSLEVENGKKNPYGISIDRIKPGGDYTISNVRLVCNIVNSMRMDYGDDILLYVCKRIVENNKL